MRTNKTSANRYLYWLTSLIVPKNVQNPYGSLMYVLNNLSFDVEARMDENRAADGRYLRTIFEDEMGTTCPIKSGQATFLEFLISMSDRVQSVLSQRDNMWEWFTYFLDRMGIAKCDDEWMAVNPDSSYFVERAVRTLNRHDYLPDGSHGGLFYIPDSPVDLRAMDLWTQMQIWAEKYYEDDPLYHD